MSRPDFDLIRWFDPSLRPWELGEVGSHYANLAHGIENLLWPGPERTEAFRKLLESMDAALRALKQTPYEDGPTPAALRERNRRLKEELGS